jgi:hypothetical protein
MLQYGDCITARRIANAVNTVDPSGQLGLRFSDSSSPQRSSSILNRNSPVNLFGDPYAGPSHATWSTGLLEYNSHQGRTTSYDPNRDYNPDQDARTFDVWDCNAYNGYGYGTPVEDPTGNKIEQDGVLFTLPLLRPTPYVAEDPAHASLYDAGNATERGTYGAQGFVVDQTTRAGPQPIGDNGVLGTGEDTCSTSQTSDVWWAYKGPGVEGGVAPNDGSQGRTQTDTYFYFTLGSQPPRGKQFDRWDLEPYATVDLDGTLQQETGSDSGRVLNATLGEGYQYGLNAFGGQTYLRPGWYGSTFLRLNAGTMIDRTAFAPSSSAYTTFYGSIGAATLGSGALTPRTNAASFYGDEWCHGAITGTMGGFDCDASQWWENADMPVWPIEIHGIRMTATAHDAYYLRDIDCSDGEVARNSGVHLSLVQLSANGACLGSPI